MKKLILCFLILLSACQASALTTLTETDAEKRITAAVNDEILITLKGNITTGYSWQFSSKKPSLYHVISEDYHEFSHPDGMVGVGGESHYHIKLLKPGTVVIYARYFRPWENFNPETDKNLTFTIDVISK